MKCKKCKSDNVKKFEVMYEQGTSNVNLASGTLGIGITGSRRGVIGLAKTLTSGKSQTLSAEKTKPPKRSRALSGTIIFLILAIPLSAAFQGFGGWTLLVCVLIGAYPLYKANLSENKKFKESHDIWIRSWYCNKCGSVFQI